MSSRADAHITRIKAGHLTPITHPEDVTKVILSAVDATTLIRTDEVAATERNGWRRPGSRDTARRP